jgi:ABC-type uncharacterized transport system substrate-binding protein
MRPAPQAGDGALLVLGSPPLYLFSSSQAGGLASYGTGLTEISERAAGLIVRLLKGARPAELPVKQPTKFELVINMKAARQLGIKIPQSILLRADEVIR